MAVGNSYEQVLKALVVEADRYPARRVAAKSQTTNAERPDAVLQQSASRDRPFARTSKFSSAAGMS